MARGPGSAPNPRSLPAQELRQSCLLASPPVLRARVIVSETTHILPLPLVRRILARQSVPSVRTDPLQVTSVGHLLADCFARLWRVAVREWFFHWMSVASAL